MRSSPITVVDPAEEEASGSGRILRFSYLFYVDLVASTADMNTQNALRHLQVRQSVDALMRIAQPEPRCSQEMAPFMRVLGCYPMDNSGRYTPASAPK